ncbi:MAG: MoaD/ThiS family protein [Acidimicrobiales bacterium]
MTGPGGGPAGDTDVDVVVRVPGALRNLCGGAASLSFELSPPATVADVVDALGRAHPALERRIRDEQGVVRTHVNLFVGDDNVRALDGLGTRLSPGTELTILAAISGGQDPG